MDKQQQAFLELRLDNWGAWARSGSGASAGRCGSAEGRYIREKLDEERFEKSSREPINLKDAEAVEHGLLKMNEQRDRLVLREWYCYRRDAVSIAGMLKIRPMLVDPARIKALGSLFYCLERWQTNGYRRGHATSNMYEGQPRKPERMTAA